MKKFISITMLTALLMGTSTAANATLSMRVIGSCTDAGCPDTVTITDETALDDAPGFVDAVEYGGFGTEVGDWTIQNLFAYKEATDPNVLSYHFDNVSISSKAGGSLQVAMTVTDLDKAPAPYMFEAGGESDGQIGFDLFMDSSNTAFGTETALDSLSDMSGAFSGTTSGGIGEAGGLFSMTVLATITHSANGTTSFNSNLTVPEPGTFALLGLGMLGLGFAGRRKAA